MVKILFTSSQWRSQLDQSDHAISQRAPKVRVRCTWGGGGPGELPWTILKTRLPESGFSQSEEISLDLCCFYGGGIRHNEDIMHTFQNFIVRLIPNHPPPLETRIWKLVVRALPRIAICGNLSMKFEGIA